MAGIVGIDVGGTFTDLYFSGSEGRSHHILKVPSTPHDPSVGLLHALEKANLQPGELDAILHGTTIATNAVIERKGARTGLLVTRGTNAVSFARMSRQPEGLEVLSPDLQKPAPLPS